MIFQNKNLKFKIPSLLVTIIMLLLRPHCSMRAGRTPSSGLDFQEDWGLCSRLQISDPRAQCFPTFAPLTLFPPPSLFFLFIPPDSPLSTCPFSIWQTPSVLFVLWANGKEGRLSIRKIKSPYPPISRSQWNKRSCMKDQRMLKIWRT